jgi:hypothetical protein
MEPIITIYWTDVQGETRLNSSIVSGQNRYFNAPFGVGAFMKFLHSLQFTAAPGVSIAGVISIPSLKSFGLNTVRSRADEEISIVRKPTLLMKWKRSSEYLAVGWISPAIS